MRNFRNFQIWKEAMELAVNVYKVSNGFPSQERFGLKSQMTRAAISIPSNIAEGASGSNFQLQRYLVIALGSSFELETQILLCLQLDIADGDDLKMLLENLNKVQRKMSAFRNALGSGN